MKKLLLVLFCIMSGLLFAQNNTVLHTGEGIITLVNYGSSWNVTFTATAVSERWGKNYNPTDIYEIATTTIPTIEHPLQKVAYFDLVIDNIAGINPIMALGKYRISAIENGVEHASFYMDWRTSGYYESPDVYFLYDMANHVFLDGSGTQNINGTEQTIWNLVPGITHDERFGIVYHSNESKFSSKLKLECLHWNMLGIFCSSETYYGQHHSNNTIFYNIYKLD